MSVAATAIPLASAVLGAVATTVSKAIIDRTGAAQLTVLTFAAIFGVMAPFAPVFASVGDLAVVVPAMLVLVVLDAAANALFFEGLALADVSKTTALNALAPLFTALLAPLLLPAHFGPAALVAAVGIVLSIYMIETGEHVASLLDDIRRPANVYVLVSAALFGGTTILTRYLLTEWAVINVPTFYWVRAAGIALVLYAVLRPSFAHIDRRLAGIITAKAGIVVVQWLLMLYAIATFNVITSRALSQTIPAFTFLLGWRALDEEFNLWRLAGIVLIIGTTILVLATG